MEGKEGERERGREGEIGEGGRVSPTLARSLEPQFWQPPKHLSH